MNNLTTEQMEAADVIRQFSITEPLEYTECLHDYVIETLSGKKEKDITKQEIRAIVKTGQYIDFISLTPEEITLIPDLSNLMGFCASFGEWLKN